jgi:hypothetical protein
MSKKVTYEAIYMPGDGGPDDPSKTGFESEDAAWEYIESRNCDACKKLQEEGNPFGGACSAEWSVDKDGWRDEID